MNTFETIVGESFAGRYVDGVGEPEYRNAVFNFENGISLSVGLGANHYTTPRGFQGLRPRREVVEIAVLRDGEFITREFYAHAFEDREELYDDVASEDTADFFSILRLVEEFAATLTVSQRNEVDEHDRIVSESSQREVDAIADDRFYGLDETPGPS